MLTPEYLEEVSNVLLPMYETLHEAIIEDVVRRLLKNGMITESAEHQLKVVQQSGLAYQDALEKISGITGIVKRELEEAFESAALNTITAENDIGIEAGAKPINLKQSEAMSRILKAELTKTQKEIHNLTLTTANAAQIAYFNASNMAYLKVTSGGFSYTDAIRQAIKVVVQQCDVITYPSGHKDKIDVAIRRAVLTGVNQTSAKLSEAYCEETECDYVETTAHSGARPDHASWQGKVFCRSGKDKKYPPFSQTGYGTGAGLCGWNCRHSFHAFFPGISTPAYTKEMLVDYDAKKYEYEGKKLTDYECSQIQRSMERDIRGKKREIAGINSAILNTDIKHVKKSLKKDFQKESVALKSKEAALKDFCIKTKRRVDGNRVQVTATRDKDGRVIGFGKSVSQKAVWSNKKQTGARSVNEILQRDSKAEDYYNAIRNYKDDVDKIVKSTGIRKKKIERIKEHLFINKHKLSDGVRCFDADYDIAIAWSRLIDGNYENRDILLLNHEYIESGLEKKYNLDYKQAHNLANKKYNWEYAMHEMFGEDGEDVRINEIKK